MKRNIYKAIGKKNLQKGDEQLGMITPEDRHPTPTIVPGLTGVKDVFAELSKKTFFLMNDNTVRVSGHSLGSSGSGMGPVGPGRIFTPVQIPGLSNVKEISPGLGFTFFLLNDQTIRATGENWIGALGNGTLTETKSIITIPAMNGIPIKQISAGSDYSLLLAVNGDVYVSGSTRGDIDTGYLGMGEMSDMSPYLQYFHNGFSTYGFKSFVKNPHLSNIKQISAGGKSSSYLTEDLVLMGAGSFFGTKTPSIKVIK